MGITLQGSGTQYQSNFAMVDSSNSLWVAVPGSVNTYGVASTGSQEVFSKTGSVNIYGTVSTVGSNYALSSPGSIFIVPLSGTSYTNVIQTTNPWIISGNVLVSGNLVTSANSLGSFNIAGQVQWTGVGSITGAITGSVIVQGFSIFEIYDFSAGSPFTTQAFSGISNSVAVQNLGSNLIYFNFNGSVSAAGSSWRLTPSNSLSVDLRVGSIMVQSSGATNSEVQVITIR